MLNGYKTILFDCDGVLLNSNSIKSTAFYKVALPYGKEIAQEFYDYHLKNGGISRYRKFEYLQEVIAPKYGMAAPLYRPTKDLINQYAFQIKEQMLHCEIAPGLRQLRANTIEAKWCVVSGGDQQELRAIFQSRNIAQLFNGGIFGSPKTKYEILEQEIFATKSKSPMIMLGDSKLDHQVAYAFGVDFLFLSGWTEFEDWVKYCRINEVTAVPHLSDLN